MRRAEEKCRACGSTKTQEQLSAEGFISCCPERTVNDLIAATAIRALAKETGDGE